MMVRHLTHLTVHTHTPNKEICTLLKGERCPGPREVSVHSVVKAVGVVEKQSAVKPGLDSGNVLGFLLRGETGKWL